jgi:hypothetical protein
MSTERSVFPFDQKYGTELNVILCYEYFHAGLSFLECSPCGTDLCFISLRLHHDPFISHVKSGKRNFMHICQYIWIHAGQIGCQVLLIL